MDSQLLDAYVCAFAHTPGLAYMLDGSGQLLTCNRHLMKQMGLDSLPEKGVGAIYKLFLSHDFGNEQQLLHLKNADIQSTLSGKHQQEEESIPFWVNNKETRWYRVERHPLQKNGEALGLFVCLIEVTELLKLKEQVEKIQKELQRNNENLGQTFHYETEDFEEKTNPRVLLVEDNILAQKAAKSALLSCDCEVDTASNAQEFSQQFSPGLYDLIFMDIGLEGTTGYLLAKEVRQQEQGSKEHVPIIALTGFDADVVKADCEYYKMEGAISKPLNVEQVQQIIQRFVRNIDIDVSGLKKIS